MERERKLNGTPQSSRQDARARTEDERLRMAEEQNRKYLQTSEGLLDSTSYLRSTVLLQPVPDEVREAGCNSDTVKEYLFRQHEQLEAEQEARRRPLMPQLDYEPDNVLSRLGRVESYDVPPIEKKRRELTRRLMRQ